MEPSAVQRSDEGLPALAAVIRRIQSSFVRSAEPHRALDPLLPDLLTLTHSEYGFIAEVWRDAAGAPFLKIFTMTNIAWDEVSRAHVERERVRGVEFHNLKTLFGAALVTERPVIANDAPNDPRAGHGMPKGHLQLDRFLGVPLHYGGEMVGMIGVANRPEGYDEALVERLDPLFQAVAGVIAAVQLDRQRRAAERELRASDERWSINFELCGAGVLQVGGDGLIVHANPRMAEIVGRTRDDLIGRHVDEIAHPEDAAARDAVFRPMLEGRTDRLLFEKRYLRPDGRVVWAQVAVTAARDAEGRFLHTVAVIIDIDQRKRAEEALQAREAHFTKLASKVPGVLMQFHIDTAGHARVPYANEGMREMFELDPDGPVREDARLMIDRVVKGQRAKVWGTLETCSKTLKPWSLEWEVDLPMRGRRWVLGRGTPERLADGSTLWHGYIDDITERKRYEEAVVAAQASERANAAKTEFLSRMSHELRTPLNAVLGFAQLLASDPRAPLAEHQSARVAHIEHAGQHLLAMIGDVLDLSRIEGGGLPLDIHAVAVRQLIEDSFALVAPTARAAGVALEFVQPADTAAADLHVRADPIRLRQVMINLLSNGIKYNRPGGQVTVEVDTALDRVCLSVTDTGFGLTPAQQTHLFEPFNRLGAERGSVEGTGLGLAITLKLVELMNGSITVHSQADRGSTFVVDLPRDIDGPPASAHEAGALAAAPRERPGAMTVLYAEDNELNVELVRQLLTLRPGCELVVARNGREAIDMARAAPPQLLLIDMHLGDMGGLQVLEALRDVAALEGVPRIALSADALPQSISAAREAGFDEYLTKPVDVERLLTVLDGHRAQAR